MDIKGLLLSAKPFRVAAALLGCSVVELSRPYCMQYQTAVWNLEAACYRYRFVERRR